MKDSRVVVINSNNLEEQYFFNKVAKQASVLYYIKVVMQCFCLL